MDNQTPQHTVKSVARNIGIGVVTPVLAATIIYFLGFNRNGSSEEFKKKKDATVNVWTAAMQNKGILSKVFIQMDQNTPLDKARENVNHEVDIAVDNMENIRKEANADQRVYSSIDIITQQIKEIKPIFSAYTDAVLAFYAENHPDSILKAFEAEKLEELSNKMQALTARDTTRLNVFYNGLNKDYSVKLPWE
ncbi:MAG: hypothetical protein WDM90_22200 [Ferruginibacter sp.]